VTELDEAGLMTLFRETGVLLDGHFLLTSGRHSPQFLQCSQLMQYPTQAALVAASLARRFVTSDIDVVVGPAMGGIILAYEVARQLGVRALFTEKHDGELVLRRGFRLKRNERVLVVEDAVTTGGSVRQTIQEVEAAGGRVVGVGVLVDRSGGEVSFGVPHHALLELDVPSYDPDECPLCDQGIPLVRPKDA